MCDVGMKLLCCVNELNENICRDARDRPSCSAELLKKHYSVSDKTAVLALADMVK